MSRKLLALLLLSTALMASACSDDDGDPTSDLTATPPAKSEWTMLAHDAASSFHNSAERTISPDNAGTLTAAWKFETAGSVTGVPAVADGRVHALASGGLYAFDAKEGTIPWHNVDIRGTSSPTLHEGKLYVNASASVLHRIDAATGAREWSAKIDPHPRAAGFSSPVVAGDLVIVGSASIEEVSARDNATFRGSMVAFDLASGREIWRYYTADPPYNGVAIWSSPSVDIEAGLVFGSTGNNYTGDAGPTSDTIFALEVETGAVRWIKQLSEGDVFTIPNPRSEDSDFGTNPVLFEATIDGTTRKLVGAGQKSGMFWALDRMTGDVVWSREVGGGSALIGGVFNNGAWDGERLIMAGNNGTSTAAGSEPSNGSSRALGGASVTTSVLVALNPADGSTIWERQLPAWVWAPITLANGVGFVSADSELQAFDTATGERLFRIDTDGTIASGAAIADGRVYFGSGLGYIGTTVDNTLHALALP